MNNRPVRLQLSRKRGAKLVSPNGLPVVIVDRRGKWGNPFRIGQTEMFRGTHAFITKENWLLYFREYAETMREDAQRELRRKNLACWCRLDENCHADIWLEIANA